MTSLLLNIFEISLVVSIVVFLTLLFCGIAGKYFTAKCRYVVWLIIVIRLCVPMNVLPITPMFSLTLPSEVKENVSSSEKENGCLSPESSPVLKENEENKIPASDNGAEEGVTDILIAETPVTKEDSAERVPVHSESEKDAKQTKLPVTLIFRSVSLLWLTGAAVFLAVTLGLYISYSRALRRKGLLSLPDAAVNEIYKKAASDMGIKYAPELRVSSAVSFPLLIGYIRPLIIIPKQDFDTEVLPMIFRHELVHYRRGDLYVKLLCAVAEALHWFNPIIHIITRKCIYEMELSCDETALKGSNEDERVLYGEALINIVKSRKSHYRSLLTTEFSSKKGMLKERIISITDSNKKRKGTAFVALMLMICIFSGALIGCKIEASNIPAEAENETTAETEEDKTENVTGEEDVSEKTTDKYGHADEEPPASVPEEITDTPVESDSESDTVVERDTEDVASSTEDDPAETDEPTEYPHEETSPEATVCEHSYTASIRTEATCTEEGNITYVCNVCSDGYTETIPAAGHSMSDADCTSPSVCRTCGAVEGVPLGHDFAEATFTSPMTCKVCGTTEGNALPPLNVDVERFKSNKDYSRPGVIPISSECSICYKAAYYDLEREYVHDAKRLSAVKIDDVAYSFDGVSETGKYNVSFTCEGEVVLDETDLDTAYICLVIFNEQTNRGTDFKLPYSDFSEGSKVEFSLSTQLESGDYRIYFKNQDVFIVDDH